MVKIKKIDKDKDATASKKDKLKEYIIGEVDVEVADGNIIKMNGVETALRKLEEDILSGMFNS